MTTLEQEAPAIIAAITENTDPGEVLQVIDCIQCGRNCRHTPMLAIGGGTAGSMAGTKFTPTARSESRCPACDGKPHRKEGRVYVEISCQYRQAMRALGSTELLHPSEAIYNKMAEMSRESTFVKVPTEREIDAMVRAKMGLPPIEPKVRVSKAATPSVVIPQATKTEEISQGETVEVLPALDITEIELSKAVKNKLMADSGTAEAPTPKEPKVKAEKPEKVKKPRKKTKKDEADAQAEAAGETEVAEPVQPEEVEVEEGALASDDDYNPFAGVGLPMDDEDDELTDAQKAALSK